MSGQHFIWIIMEKRGIRQDWLAAQLGISEAYVSLLRSGRRQWTTELKKEASRVLMLPVEVLFAMQAEMEL